jgi:hypothetical protein
MATKVTIPIPRDKIGESFVWRDWFQKLSDRVFGTLASQDASNVNITGGTISGLSSPLPIGSGGTNGIAVPTAYGIAYGTGTAYAFTSAGTAKQALLANTGSAPTWSTLTTGSSILYGDGSGGFSNVTIGSGVSFAGGTLSATGSGGTVTLVTGTSPVVSSGGTTPAISLATAYGDTLNPYGAKTAAYVLAGPTTGAAAAPTFRALTTADIPALSYVTSVALALPSIMSVSGSPVTSSGTLTGALTTQAANAIFAGPSSGLGATPTFRALTTADIPALAYGSVTSVSVVSANGFAGTVATATTTPAITISTSITGVLKGNGTAISAAVANTDYVPLSTVLTVTADYTITGTDSWIINNKATTALTLTFPAASSWTGRSITVKNLKALAVNSASSNIVPLDSATAGTAILLGVIGNWAKLISDGTNWVIMEAAPNNILLLE